MIKRIGLLLSTMAITILVLDLASRPIYDRLVHVRPTAIYKNRWPVDPRVNRYDANVSFSNDIIGGLALMTHRVSAIKHHVEFVTDAHGFRNRPEALHRENVLLLVGDSFGAGSASTQEDMLAAVLSREYGLENYNLSVGAHSPWQEFMTLQYEYDRIPKSRDATIIWLLFEGNDLDHRRRDDDAKTPNGWFTQLRLQLEIFINRSPIKQSIERLASASRRLPPDDVLAVPHGGQSLLFYRDYLRQTGRTLQQIKSHPNFPHLVSVFERMAAFAREGGNPLVVVLIPTKERVYEWIATGGSEWRLNGDMSAFGKSIMQLARAHDVEYIDLLPTFNREAERLYRGSQEYLYWPDDTHWNALGQAVGAHAIAERLGSAGS